MCVAMEQQSGKVKDQWKVAPFMMTKGYFCLRNCSMIQYAQLIATAKQLRWNVVDQKVSPDIIEKRFSIYIFIPSDHVI